MYTDNAGTVSKSAEGLVKMMAVIVAVFKAAGLIRNENGDHADHAAADTTPGTPDFTARHRSSGPEV